MARQFRQVGVVGLGTMGAGIVEVFARGGLSVLAVEADEASLARGQQHLERSTARALTRGRLTDAEARDLRDRVSYSTSLDAIADADLVVEAVPERLELKRAIFTELDRVCKPDAILATNTSSLSITEIAATTTRPAQVVGMHFFNPAPVMKLVEVVHSVMTEPDVVADVETLAQQLGKVHVTISDRAGFIANALLLGYLNHAAAMYESRFAGREDIDAAMTLGCGLPMGPLTLLDLIGLDTAYEVLDRMYKQGRDRLHAPAPIFKQLISAGFLGRKSGRGFYSYEPEPPRADEGAPAGPEVHRVGVVGSGSLATAISAAFAGTGFETTRVAADRVSASDDLGAVQLVIEAVDDDRATKESLFADLDKICTAGTVLATTTSRLPVITCAAATRRAHEVIGLHFLDPSTVTKLVEVVSTVATAPAVEASAVAACRALGAHPVRCRDQSGFVVQALLFPYLNDAVKMLEAHYASVEDIDAAMKLGCGYPMGPFEVLDEVGLDVALAIERDLYRELREPGYAPAPLLEQLVTAGRLGRKAGKGFRDY
jgi:3-hydroxybutyryl-CoA dehydrogenase